QEAAIVAQAGVPGAITVATNMAGRGTDIQLGGNLEMRVADESAAKEQQLGRSLTEAERAALEAEIKSDIEKKKEQALEAGGLYVLATERHESRRIDNQLRGRTGRQGDPGKSKFYICLEDDLLRIFAADRLDAIMRRLGIQEDEAIVHPWMNKALETSQKRVEQRNFEIRKNLLKYDDVINDQRKAIFEQRIDFMRANDVAETIRDMRHQVVEDMVFRHMPEKAYAEQWNLDALEEEMRINLGLDAPVRDWASAEGAATSEVADKLIEAADDAYAKKAINVGDERMRWLEKQILLQEVDTRWREHLSHLDQLRSVIHLRGYAQRDPLNEFKTEAFTLFETLLSDLRGAVTTLMMRVQIAQEAPPPPLQPPTQTVETRIDPQTGFNDANKDGVPDAPGGERLAPSQMRTAPGLALAQGVDPNDPSTWSKTPRNALCPCGSGKKYKHCHGAVSAVEV
ncbi:MAG: SEC-C metal-binding domain-containing protein, partial [Pseudomonadota bacterium]